MFQHHINSENARWVGHGFPGGFELNGSVVTSASLDDPKAVQALSARLKGARSLELLSCFVADGIGKQFVRKLAQALGVSVFASSRAVGPAHLGGTYFLDYGYCPSRDQDVDGYQAQPVQGLNTLLPVLTVPFYDGYVGKRGTNNQKNNDINTYASMGIDKAYFSQVSTTNEFQERSSFGEAQGNDVPGYLTIESGGKSFQIPGYIGWQDKLGGKSQSFGFLPDDNFVYDTAANGFSIQFQNYKSGNAGVDGAPEDWVVYGEYADTLDGDISNFGLVLFGVDQDHYTNEFQVMGNDVGGSADLKDVLRQLNEYLTYIESLGPEGEVTVESQGTSDSTPEICGTVQLDRSKNEVLEVTVNGVKYSEGASGDGVVILSNLTPVPGTTLTTYTWCLTIPASDALSPARYDVTATIFDTDDDFSKSDSSSDELVVLGDAAVFVNDVTVNEGSPYAIFTAYGPASGSVFIETTSGTLTSSSPAATKGTDFGNIIQYYDHSTSIWTTYDGNAADLDSDGILYLRVPINNDSELEGNENYRVTVTNAADSSKTYTGTGIIEDSGYAPVYLDGAPPPEEDITVERDQDATISVSDVTVAEESLPADGAVFNINISETNATAISLSLGDGNAPLATGFEPSDATLTGIDFGKEWNNNQQNYLRWKIDSGSWSDYDETSLPTITSSNTLYVSVKVEDDSIADSGETFRLNASYASFPAINADGLATITDTDPASSDTVSIVSSNNVEYNEASDWAVFTITAVGSPTITEFSVADGDGGQINPSTSGLSGGTVQYYDTASSTWKTLGDGGITLANNEQLFVRVAINAEQDDWVDNNETFRLISTLDTGEISVGVGTIKDDGTGTIFTGNIAGGVPEVDTTTTPDNDFSINNITVNEGSDWAQFTVSGVAGKTISLELECGAVPAGSASSGLDYTSSLQYSVDGGANWTAYTGGFTPTVGEILVRNPVLPDDIADDGETYSLCVTSSGTTIVGIATIKDDGTGTIWDNDGNEDNSTTKDDDGDISVNNISVNEGTHTDPTVGPWAVFTITANEGLVIDELTLADVTADDIDDNPIYYWNVNNSSWALFEPGTTQIPVDSSQKVYVRTSISDEQDDVVDNGETFTLRVGTTRQDNGTGPLGTATINDDGSGDEFDPAADPTDSGPVTTNLYTDTDTAIGIAVDDVTVNEGSPYAVFTVTAAQNTVITNLAITDGDTTGDFKTNGLSDNTLEYWDGFNWNPFDGNAPVTIGSSGALLVRVSITDEQDPYIDDGEKFQLTVTDSNSSTAVGTGTIKDDATGKIYPDAAPSDPSTPSEDNSTPKDNDSGGPSVDINDVVVNEASTYAINLVTGPNNYILTDLQVLSSGNTSITNFDLQVYDGNNWVDYVSGSTALSDTGELLVRTTITEEQEDESDNGEIYTLSVNPTGTVTIVDDGTGQIFTGQVDPATGAPITLFTGLDNDGPAPAGDEPSANAEPTGFCGWYATTGWNNSFVTIYYSEDGASSLAIRDFGAYFDLEIL